MTAKLPGNQNQLWTFSDAPPVPNRYPEIENGPHTIKNVFTGESIAYTSDGNYAGTGSSGTVRIISIPGQATHTDRKW